MLASLPALPNEVGYGFCRSPPNDRLPPYQKRPVALRTPASRRGCLYRRSADVCNPLLFAATFACWQKLDSKVSGGVCFPKVSASLLSPSPSGISLLCTNELE